jgi:hypothetical protein
MDQRTVQAEMAAARRLERRRRVKRGVVAGYIHEISARHQLAAGRPKERREALLSTSRAA